MFGLRVFDGLLGFVQVPTVDLISDVSPLQVYPLLFRTLALYLPPLHHEHALRDVPVVLEPHIEHVGLLVRDVGVDILQVLLATRDRPHEGRPPRMV